MTARRCLAVLLGVVLSATSCAGPSGSSSQSRAGVQPHQVAVPDSLRTFRSPERAAAVPEPVRVRIPSLAVDSPLERLGRSRGGTVEVPAHWVEPAGTGTAPAPVSMAQR